MYLSFISWVSTKIIKKYQLVRPDFQIGEDYMLRWWVAKNVHDHDTGRLGRLRSHTFKNKFFNIYLHCVTGSDDERAFHDHPWRNISIILRGSYIEHTPEGHFLRKAGDIVFRKAEALHRLEVNEGPVWSLFIAGRKLREWGFMCPKGWRHWKVFTSYDETGDSTGIGRGCD